MTRFNDREQARILRSQGKSYSEIRESLVVSKSTLSGWLTDMPLSADRIRQLRDLNPRRIERFRETMRRKREGRMQLARKRAEKDIGTLSHRDLFIAGFYLYWGEGMKSHGGMVSIANTDPAIIRSFMEWLELLGVEHSRIRAHVHLYADMNPNKEMRFWSEKTGLSLKQFRKPYIKESRLTGLTYKNGHGHGTCNVIFQNTPLSAYITGALAYLRERCLTLKLNKRHAPVAQW